MSLPSGTPPRLLDQVREVIRIRHYSIRSEQAYVQWIRRFILFHGKRHPREMGVPELSAFLSDLGMQHNVAASTQNQALHAILFLCRDVLKIDLPWLDQVLRSSRRVQADLFAARACYEVSERGSRIGLAIRVPVVAALGRSGVR